MNDTNTTVTVTEAARKEFLNRKTLQGREISGVETITQDGDDFYITFFIKGASGVGAAVYYADGSVRVYHMPE